uniref:Tetratricopeptide repeat protein n=1 Tax=Bradyrhizobium japonicum TaxID=375 RepID=Q45274_BRAJP|nr:unknown protein [Bradyrhizobium japonicum]
MRSSAWSRLPVIASGFYLALGSPRLGDFPSPSARWPMQPTARQSGSRRSRRISKRTDRRPRLDGAGPVLSRLGRYDDAVRAYRKPSPMPATRDSPRRSRRR